MQIRFFVHLFAAELNILPQEYPRMLTDSLRPLRIGLLFSTTGTTSIVEEGQLQACLLAIDEINSRSKVRFKAVIEDIKSNPQVAAEKADQLLRKEKVDLLVGCWTSACRKAVLPVLDETGALLLYPTNYEGQESHPQVFYLGAVPNQQVESTLSWVVGNLASRFILLGSDYIYPRSANQQVRQWVERIDPKMIVLEKYFPLGCADFGNLLEEMRPLLNSGAPTVIFSNLVGSSVADFYSQYQQAAFKSPIISPITSEREIEAMGPAAAAGHCCTSGYFQSLDNAENHNFVGNCCRRFGETTVNGSMEFAYNAIRLLEMSVDEKLLQIPDFTERSRELQRRLQHLSIDAPQGKLIVDPQNQHLWLWSRIGRVRENGSIEIVWSSPGPIPPRPFSEATELAPRAITIETRHDSFAKFVGNNPLFHEKIRIGRITARTSSNVLIRGEQGSGKRLFARAIHQSSALAAKPFVELNCADIPSSQLKEELFGKRGQDTQPGRLEQANGGILLLNEVAGLPLALQHQLLTFLQDGQFQRPGEEQLRPLEVRIIATTSRDLLQEIAFNGTFLSDLYNHINVFSLQLPALRERNEDIPLLAAHYLRTINKKNRASKSLAANALTAICNHSWPGNIRELITVLERAFYLSLDETTIQLNHLPPAIVQACSKPQTAGLADTEVTSAKQDSEKLKLEAAIRTANYNMSLAAKALGMSRSTLYRKIDKHRIKLKAEILSS
jgi:DNA-binding NtrC family response regulator/ABC-type branched-subunit amino acid transport system substrate-binding protein